MSLPYATAPHGWRFVILLHRLAALPQDSPLRIAPANQSALQTARAKIFQGRSFILSTHDPALARYANLAQHSIIHTLPTRIELTRSTEFDLIYGTLAEDTFTLIYRAANCELMKFTKAFTIPFGTSRLSTPQVRALKDFLTNAPNVKYVNITPEHLIVSR